MWRRLLKVEPMGRSLSAYAPLVGLDKLLTFARVVLLTWLVGKGQYGIWSLGVMVFSILAPVATLGSYESVARYVSYYQARRQLRLFYRRTALWTGGLALASLAVGIAASGPLAGLLVSSKDAAAELSHEVRVWIVILGVVNGIFTALYHNLRSFIRGLRTFRLLGVVELAYSLLFTVLALAAAAIVPAGQAGMAILVVHAASLLMVLVVGGLVLHWIIGAGPGRGPSGQEVIPADEEVGTLSPGTLVEHDAQPESARAALVRLLGFGSLAMFSSMVWNVGNQVSAYVVNRHHGTEAVGVYSAFRQICQPVWILSGILWGLVFSYVASHWERRFRRQARKMLLVTYKAVVAGLMTMTVLILATAPWWSLLIEGRYRAEPQLFPMLAGLLMFFQASANLGLASIAAKLRERPGAIVAMTLAGVLVNVVLAAWWVPKGRLAGAAWAAGIGMLVPCVLGSVYLLATRFRVHPAAHALALCPVILLLPPPAAATVWAACLIVAVASPWVFNRHEKHILWLFARGILRRRREEAPEGGGEGQG